METSKIITTAHPAIRNFFFEEIILLGRVFVSYQNEEDLIFRCARMLDWLFRRYTGQAGNYENEIIERLLRESYNPHLSTSYLLEKHFSEADLESVRGGDERESKEISCCWKNNQGEKRVESGL